jgi:hypothetical protein
VSPIWDYYLRCPKKYKGNREFGPHSLTFNPRGKGSQNGRPLFINKPSNSEQTEYGKTVQWKAGDKQEGVTQATCELSL